eukprot:3729610-Pyramimonas_sp.AAC.1
MGLSGPLSASNGRLGGRCIPPMPIPSMLPLTVPGGPCLGRDLVWGTIRLIGRGALRSSGPGGCVERLGR